MNVTVRHFPTAPFEETHGTVIIGKESQIEFEVIESETKLAGFLTRRKLVRWSNRNPKYLIHLEWSVPNFAYQLSFGRQHKGAFVEWSKVLEHSEMRHIEDTLNEGIRDIAKEIDNYWSRPRKEVRGSSHSH